MWYQVSPPNLYRFTIEDLIISSFKSNACYSGLLPLKTDLVWTHASVTCIKVKKIYGASLPFTECNWEKRSYWPSSPERWGHAHVPNEMHGGSHRWLCSLPRNMNSFCKPIALFVIILLKSIILKNKGSQRLFETNWQIYIII